QEPRGWNRRFPSRPSIEARARNIARLLLRNAGWWDTLAAADHEVLCGLEGEFGAFFRWMDREFHEHGAQPLAALQVGVQDQEFEATVLAILAEDSLQPHGRVVDDPETPFAELQAAILAFRLDVLDLQLRQVRELPGTDPDRVRQETELIKEQFALKKQQFSVLKTSRKDIM
ncbi:MAG: hypothetical protein H0U68_21730, partial [Ramlibacter sp.]|nr:hypothetical protein [Ramlibacter sp.]